MSDFVMTRLTPDGTILELELDPVSVRLDGREAEIISHDRYRDGGSQAIKFILDGATHSLFVSRRMSAEHYEMLDGERLEARP